MTAAADMNKDVSGQRVEAANTQASSFYFQNRPLHDLHGRVWRVIAARPDDKTLGRVGSDGVSGCSDTASASSRVEKSEPRKNWRRIDPCEGALR
jgi:hypothetical protein